MAAALLAMNNEVAMKSENPYPQGSQDSKDFETGRSIGFSAWIWILRVAVWAALVVVGFIMLRAWVLGVGLLGGW